MNLRHPSHRQRFLALSAAIYLAAILRPTPASAQPAYWDPAAGGNGHYYEVVAVPTGINWWEARLQAAARGGQLATITSAAENTFVHGLAAAKTDAWYVDGANNTQGPFLGALQADGSPEPAGGWAWITGELFTYTNWSANEPNNGGNNEKSLQYYGLGPNNRAATWNDIPETLAARGYIVEIDLTTAAGFVSHEVAQDFSPTTNPNPPWSYGWAPSPGGAFTVFNEGYTSSSLHFWQRLGQTLPSAAFNPTAGVISPGTAQLAPGKFHLHPGPAGEAGVLRFIAPVTGLYEIQAAFQGADPTGTSTDVHVYFGAAEWFQAVVNGFGLASRQSHRTVAVLTAGQTVDFVVGHNGNYNYDTTQVDATVAYRGTFDGVAGEIAYAGEVDSYSFQLTSAGTYYFDSLVNNGSLNWTLTGPIGTAVNARAFSSSDGDNISDPLLRLPAGDYTLTIRGSGATVGPYEFRLLNLSDATLITAGTTISNFEFERRTTDLYQFVAAAGDSMTFDGQTLKNGGSPYWRLVDPLGRILWANYFADVSNFKLTASGTYTLLMESHVNGGSGTSYSFVLVDGGNTPPPSFVGTPLTLGVGITNVIASPGATNPYTFTLAQPTRLYFDSLTNNGSLRYTLFGPGGTMATTRGVTGGAAADLHFAPAGDYQLVMSAVGGYAGSFAFRLLDLATATPITLGTVVNGTATPASGLRLYRFNATPGTRLFIDALSQSGFTYFGNAFGSMLDPYGNLLFADNSFGDRATTTLTGDGVYTVWIAGGDHEPGAQGNFSFNLVPVTETTTALALDTVYQGTVATPGQRHFYTFTLADTKRVHFQSLTNQTNIRWTLSGPSGEVQPGVAFSPGSWSNYTLPAGEYQLTVYANGDITGGYRFSLMDTALTSPFAVGDTVNGLLEPAATVKIYEVPLQAGDRLFVDALAQSGFTYYGTCWWRLEDPEGNAVYLPDINVTWDRGFGDFGPFTVQRTATYRLFIGGSVLEPQPQGNYSFRILPVVDATQPLTFGQVIEPAITSPGQQLVYTFTLNAPTRVQLDNQRNTPNLRWTLAGADRTYASTVGFGSDAWFAYDLPAGDYRLTINTGSDATGTARFRLLAPVSATPVALDTTINLTLVPPSENLLLAFTGTAGQRVYFDVLSQSGFTYYGQPYWRLESPSGSVVFDTSTGDNGPLVLPASGTYTLRVGGNHNEAQPQGNLSFRINNSPLTTSPLVLDAVTTGELAVAGETDRFTFTLAQTTPVVFDSRTNSALRVSLSGPTGLLANAWGFNGLDGVNRDSYFNLPAGNYSLDVTGSGDATGGYAFALRTLASGEALTLNTTVNGTLDPANATRLFRFNAAAGDRVRFQALSQTGLPNSYWRLRDPQGDLVWAGYFNGSTYSNLLARTGAYTVQLEGFYAEASASGSFSFSTTTFTPTPPPGLTGTLISLGQIVSNTLPTAASVQSYLFTLSQPTLIGVDYLRPLDGFSWALIGPSGPVHPMHSVFTAVSHPPLPAGTYELQFTGAASPYAFRVLDYTTAPFYVPGTRQTNEISPSAGAMVHRVNLIAGQPMYFDLISESGFAGSPWKTLTGPALNTLFQITSASDSGTFVPNQSGEHYLTIDGTWNSTASTGTVVFALSPVTYTTNALTLGATISGTLDAGGGDVDSFTFTLTGTERIFFDVLNTATVNWTWSLTGPAGVIVNDRSPLSSDSYDFADSSLLLGPGNYTLAIQSTSIAASPYGFRLLRAADAGAFALGDTVTTNAAPASSTTLLRFSGTAGQLVFFDYLTQSGYGQAPTLRVYSPAGNFIQNQGFASDRDTFTLPLTGEYLAAIEGRIYDANPAGSLTFAYRPVTHLTNSLVFDQVATAAITVPGTRHYWTFSLATPQRLWFDTLTNAPGATWTLTRGQNVLVNDRSFVGSDGIDFADPSLTLPAGVYVIRVELGLGNTGTYAFRLVSPASATPMQVDVNTAVLLDPPVATRLLTFNATAGERFYFDGLPQTGAGNSNARLYDPFGAKILDINTVSDAPTFVLPFTGAYTFAVEGRIYNSGAGITANFALISNPPKPVEPLFESTSLPDLVVDTVSVTPPAGLRSGDPFTVNWTVRNSGALATSGAFTDRVSVRNTTLNQIVLNTTLAYNPADAGNGAIAPGTQRNRQLALTLPAGAAGAGNLEVTVTTDTFNQLAEYNTGGTGEANNGRTANFSSTLAPYPDLQVIALAANPPTGWASGNLVQISWGVTNSGVAAASTSWVDRVIVRNLSRSVVLLSTNVAHDFNTEGALTVGGRRNRTAQFVVPAGLNGQGEFEISVEADALAAVVEAQTDGSGEDDNLTTITVRSAPDLQVSGVQVTAIPSARSGADLQVQWTLSNAGNAPVESAFSDRVRVRHLGSGSTLVDTTAAYNPAAVGAGAIVGGATRNRSLTVKLPDGPNAVGNLEIEVVADTFNQVFELTAVGSGENNNSATANLNTVLAPYPDLLVNNVTVTPPAPQSGQEITIRWEDANQGDTPAAGNWYDRVQIVNTATLGTLLDTTVYHNTTTLGALTNGTSRLRQHVFRLPNGLAGSGALRVTVTADSFSSIFEYNGGGTAEANNAASSDFNATLAAYPDLEVASFNVTPPAFESGRLLTATWVLTNTGTATITGDFYDRVLVRNLSLGSTILDQSYYLNPAADANGPIAVGQARTRSASFTLPDGPAGAGNIEVALFLDSGNRIFEFREVLDAELNNNTNLTRNSTVALYPDLAVSNVTAPATGLPGQTIDVSWTVANNGVAATPLTWTDQVFLVDDANPNAPQLLGSFAFDTALGIGGSANVTRTVTLPYFVVGNRRLAVKANSGPAFYEPNFANNYTLAAATTGLSPRLELTLNRSSVGESGGNNSVFLTVLRNGSTTADLTVNLANPDPDRLSLPATTTIPAGQTYRTLAVGVLGNTLVDGNRTIGLGASAAGYSPATVSLLVQDDDTPALTMQLTPGTVNEDAGPAAAIGYLTRNTDTNAPLSVTVISDAPSQLLPPATVVIPAGQRSVAFDIDAPLNTTIEGLRDVRIRGSALGYQSGSAEITVIDNDAPVLSLELAAAAIVEGAESPATSGMLSRQPPFTAPLNVQLGQTLPGLLLVPTELTIPAGAGEVLFNVNVTDDLLVNGTRTNDLIARIRGATGTAITNGQAIATLLVFDNDGPSLTLTLARDVVAETGTVSGTVSRNTGTTGALTVNLASDDPGEAQPASPTVTIPNGQTSVGFTINGVSDGANDGIQPAIITASATGFNSATARLNVSDVDLPDLAVGDIIVPSSGQIDARANVTFTVGNPGPVPATGTWIDRVYISSDNQLGGDTLAGAVTNTAALAPNSTYTRTVSITLPANPGSYHVIVVTDADNTLVEGSERNNIISIATIDVQPNYRASVATALVTAPCGTAVPITGRAFNPDDNSPAKLRLVTVRVLSNGSRRLFNVFTDLDGTFSLTFTPLPTETGDYQLAADHPRVNEDTVQDTFSLLGFSVSATGASMTIVPETDVTGQITLRNMTGVPLTGISASAPDAPAALGLQLSVPSTLAGNATATLDWTLNTTITNAASVTFPVIITAAEGCTQRVLFLVNIAPLRPQLVVEPAFLERGMVRGEQALVPFTVRNVGGVASGLLDILPPAVSWLKIAGTNQLASLEPGQSTSVTLLLEPPADLPLILYTGNLSIGNSRVAVSVPFRFRALSTAVGDLKITATDDYTYYVAGAPKLTNAVVSLSDPFTGQSITNGVTDEAGEVRFVGLAEGAYTVDVTAPKHNTFRGTATIQPGVETALEAFLVRQTVTYRWSVVPVEVEDRYRVVLESVFETEVPVPKVVVEEPFIMPLVIEGQTNQFDIALRNVGLIAAEDVQILVPANADYLIQPLVTNLGTLPAKSRVVIPVMISRRQAPAGSLQLAGLDPRLNEGGCEIGVGPCLPKITLNVVDHYTCGANGVYQNSPISLAPICVALDIQACIESILGAAGSLHGGNLANIGCDILAAVLQCAGINLTPCQSAALAVACGAATGGLAGAASNGLGPTLECLCEQLQGFSIPIPSSPPNYGTVNYVNGSILGTMHNGFNGIPWSGGWYIGPGNCSAPSGNGLRGGGNPPDPRLMDEGVCARVRLQIEQEAVMTRVAFKGSLEIENSSSTAITGIRLSLEVRDAADQPAGTRFVVTPPVVTGMGNVDGTGVVNGFGLGSAEYLFRPTRDAAPNAPALYRIGGTLRYLENGQEVVVPLVSSTITVYPEARLQLLYFQQRDVFSDDPFTDEVEPTEPFALGLIAKNNGAGEARNFRITSAQPKIIENSKGLLIDFKIIGSQLGASAAEPSLTLNFGNIPAGQSQVGQWLFTSSLQGKFIEYSATFEHVDNFGSTNLSLIDSVEIHELIKPVLADRTGDDASPDFLANDIPDPASLPDVLYFSDGSSSVVQSITTGNFSNAIGAGARQATLTFAPTTGWQYVRLPDPGPGWSLHRVVRSDNKQLKVGTNVWTTDRTFPSALTGVVREHTFHLLDHNSTGSYVAYYRPVDTVPPVLVSVGPVVPSFQTAAVSAVEVVFSEEVDLATFTPADLTLSLNGGPNLVTGAVTVTQTATNRFNVGNLAALTSADGNYGLTVNAASIEDFGGNTGSGALTTTWAKGGVTPVITGLGPVTPNPRNVPLDTIEAAFSRAINAATFTREDVTLTRNGGGNLITPAIQINQLETNRFLLSGLGGLTQLAGNYTLTVVATGVEDTDGTAGTGLQSAAWSMVTTGPQIASLQPLATNPRNIVVATLDVTFAAPINPATFTWQDLTLTRNGGPNLITSAVTVSAVSPTVFRIANFNWVVGQEGEYAFTVSAGGILDAAGNTGSGSAAITWQMDTTRPGQPVNLALAPDLGVSATDELINTLTPTLTGTLPETNLTVRVSNLTTGADYGTAAINGQQFAKPLAFATAGAHQLQVRVVDAAGNTAFPDVLLDTFVDLTQPSAVITPVTPAVRNSPVSAVTVTLSEDINPATFTRDDFTLRRQNGANLINGGVQVVNVAAHEYQLTGLAALTDTAGNYELALNMATVEDRAGNSGTNLVSVTWARTGSNQAPTLAAIADRSARVGETIIITNIASDPDVGQRLAFSLNLDAPSGAVVGATNGVFQWTPTRSQSPGVYALTVTVTDDGVPPANAARTFIVGVEDFTETSLGEAVLLAGENGAVNVTLISTAGLTNLVAEVAVPTNRLTTPQLGSLSALVSASSVQALGDGRYRLSLRSQPGQSIRGSNVLAQLQFGSAAPQSSAFLPLPLSNITARQPDGSVVGTTFAREGRVVMIGDQPLLEITRGGNGPTLRLFARPGDAHDLERTTGLGGLWDQVERLRFHERELQLPLSAGVSGTAFYRLASVDVSPPFFEILSVDGAGMDVAFYAERGLTFDLQTNSNPVPPWNTVKTQAMTNQFHELRLNVPPGNAAFLRARGN